MDIEAQDTPLREPSWQESHPWLIPWAPDGAEEDSIGEVVRCTLDELRLA